MEKGTCVVFQDLCVSIYILYKCTATEGVQKNAKRWLKIEKRKKMKILIIYI